MSKVSVLPSSPATPEMMLRWLLSRVDEVDSLCLVFVTKEEERLTLRFSTGFQFDSAALASGMMMHMAVEQAEAPYEEDGSPHGGFVDPDLVS